MTEKFGLSKRTIDELLDYFRSKSNIKKVVLYGSRAKNTFKTGSDIDFAIWTDIPNLTSSILDELENLPTPYKFDVTDYNSLDNDNLKQSINNFGILFYEKR